MRKLILAATMLATTAAAAHADWRMANGGNVNHAQFERDAADCIAEARNIVVVGGGSMETIDKKAFNLLAGGCLYNKGYTLN